MNEVLKRIYGLGVIPVVVIDNATHAIPLAATSPTARW